MATALIGVVNHADASATTISASSSATGNAASEVAKASPQLDWRSATAATAPVTAYLDLDFAADVSIGVVAGAFRRAGPVPATSDTIRLQLDADGGAIGTGALLDVDTLAATVDPNIATLFHKPASAISARYLRLTLTLAGQRQAALGRLWAGPVAAQPAINIVHPLERLWADLGRVRRHGLSGTIRSDAGPRPREIGFRWDLATTAEGDELEEAQRIAGTTGQALFCWDPDAPAKTTILGALADPQDISDWTFGRSRLAGLITEDL